MINRETNTMNIKYFSPGNLLNVPDYQTSIPITTYVNSPNTDPDNKEALVNSNVTDDFGNNPERYPIGEFAITGIIENPKLTKDGQKDDRFGDYFLTTTAYNGNDCIHFTTLGYTWGCIGVLNKEDMDSLIALYKYNQSLDPNSASVVSEDPDPYVPREPETHSSEFY